MSSIIAELYENEGLRNKYGSDGKYSMPLYDTVDPALKDDPKYYIDVAEAAFSLLMKNRCALPGSSYRYIQILRDYGVGNQSESYYINLFRKQTPDASNANEEGVDYDTDGYWTRTPESRREGLENLNTQIVSPATNLKFAIHGIASTSEQSIYCNSLDNSSITTEEEKLYGAYFDSQNLDFYKGVKEQYGIDLLENENIPGDVTIEELMVYKEMGGFRNEWCAAMEQLVKHTELSSDWEHTIKRKYVDDWCDLNMIGSRCYYDSETGEERWGYCDPGNMVMQYSKTRDYNDAEYGGYFDLMKLGKLEQKGFPRDKLIAAARRYEFYFGNYRGINWKDVESGRMYDDRIRDFFVPVFHYYWIDIDTQRSLRVKNEYGRVSEFDIEFDKEVKPVSDYRKKKGVEQEERKTKVRRTRQCSWIVDTDMAFDIGICPNQGRKSTKEPMLPLFMWRGITTNDAMIFGSIIESIIPFLDNLQLAWLKYQDALIKSNPGGYLVNLRLLQNLEMGGKKIDPIQAFEMFWKTGRMPYMDTALGENYKGGSVLPMTYMQGTTGELMATTANEIHFNLSMIEKLTGINSAPLGQSPDKDQPVSSVKMAAMGTNNVIRPMFTAMYRMKERLADLTVKRIPLLIRNNTESKKTYERIVGARSVAVIEAMEREGAEYGIYMDARPTQQEIDQILLGAEEALSPGRDGKVDINLSQYTYIIEQVRSGGNIKKLSRDLSFMIRRNEEQQAIAAQQNIQAQTQQQQQMKQQEAQLNVLKQKGETMSQIAIDNNEAKNEAKLEQLKANLAFKNSLYKQKQDLVNARLKNQYGGSGVRTGT